MQGDLAVTVNLITSFDTRQDILFQILDCVLRSLGVLPLQSTSGPWS